MTTIPPIFLTLAAILGVVGFAALLWPGAGGVAWSQRRHANAGRIQREDALKHLCNTEAGGRRPPLHSLAGALNIKPD